MTTGARDRPLVVADGLTKRFGPTPAVDGVSFGLDRGTVSALLGPNGAGKTTTMRMLVGLCRPDAGEATICGVRYEQLEDPLRTVGVSLDSAGFHPNRRARDELAILSDAGGLPHDRVAQVLDMVELDRRGGRIAGFSTGMRQRLGLAAALLGDPLVLLLDEPAAGLDPAGRAWLRGFLGDRARAGCAVLVSSHVLAEVEQEADRVLILNHGRLLVDAPTAGLLSRAGVQVIARTPSPGPLADRLRALGGQVRAEGDLLRVTGLPLDLIGDTAGALGVTVRELRAETSRLEDVFLALTGPESPGHGAPADQSPRAIAGSIDNARPGRGHDTSDPQ